MNKTIIYALCCLLFASACKKDSVTEPNQSTAKEKYLYTLKVGGLMTAEGEVNSPATSSLKDKLTYLYFYQFNGDEPVVINSQVNTDPDFGTYVDSLAFPDEYDIYVFGSNEPLNLLGGSEIKKDKSYFMDGKDMFFGQVKVLTRYVGVEYKPDSVVDMQRVNAQLEVVLTGEDSRTKFIRATVYHVIRAFKVSGGYEMPLDTIDTKTFVVPYIKGQPFKFNTYVFPSIDATVVLEAIGSKNTPEGQGYFTKQISDIQFKRNTKLTITGDLFKNYFPTNTFQIKVDTEWEDQEDKSF